MSEPFKTLPSTALDDPDLRMPATTPGPSGLAWLRQHVPRFTDGERHTALRQGVVAVIDRLDGLDDAEVRAYAGDPTRTLLHALDLPLELADDVELAAAAYQPHADQSAEADAAADRLVEACGGRTDEAAALVCVLLQSPAATRRVIELRRTGSDEPPLRATRRRTADGTEVEVDLTDAPFGAGPHRCPGEAFALRMVDAALTDNSLEDDRP